MEDPSGHSHPPVYRRKEPYDQVWASPIREVAKRYPISDVALAKICARLDVPRPPRGHWAKKAVGKEGPQLPIAPSAYHEQRARKLDPGRLPERAKQDAQLRPEIQREWQENQSVYGAEKVWRQMKRESFEVARCTVARLMRHMGLRRVVREQTYKPTVPELKAARPPDLVARNFTVDQPNRLWVADLDLRGDLAGFVYVAFVIDAYSRRIVGWRVSSSLRTDLALDALEQAIYDRSHEELEGLIHHSDRGVQNLSIRYTERLAEARIEPSVGSVGDSYDNALAESVIGLFKTEVIRRRGP